MSLSEPTGSAESAVFPFPMFPEVDPLLGPEMRSTGEVLGMSESFGLAFYKAQEAAKMVPPQEGTVLVSVSERDRPAVLQVAGAFRDLGIQIRATRGTHQFLEANKIPSRSILKLHEGRPDIVDAIRNGELQLVVNTPIGKLSQHDDSYIRKEAIRHQIPYITTLTAALAAAKGIAARREDIPGVKSLQDYHRDLAEPTAVN